MSTVNGFQVGANVLKYSAEALENYNTPNYSSSSTYAVGDYVMYQGKLYKCKTAITTAEAWTAAHWDTAILSNDVSDLKSQIEKTARETVTDYYKIPLAYIDSSGKVVAASASSGQYSYDLYVLQVGYNNNIASITCNYSFVYGFFVNPPELGSTTYNNSRTSSGGATTLNNIKVPDGVNWIAVRIQHDDGTITVSKNPYIKDVPLLMRSVKSSGNMNDFIDPGFYVHSAGTTITNAPDTGGIFWVGKIDNTVCQIYIPNRASNEGKFYIRKIIAGTPGSWFAYYASNISGTKIALFGDSIAYGSIKTITDGSAVTTRANPEPAVTIGNILHCTVTNFSVGGMGYIKQIDGQNIYEKLQATDLTGYSHVLFLAGDNDSSVGSSGIGTFTDTTGTTIMAQLYNIITYLHTNYPNIKPIFIAKNNKMYTTSDGINIVNFGSFPDYYYGYTYGNGFSISALNAEMKKFCDYYFTGFISLENFCGGYNLQALVGNDGTHYTQEGYNALAQFIAGHLLAYVG